MPVMADAMSSGVGYSNHFSHVGVRNATAKYLPSIILLSKCQQWAEMSQDKARSQNSIQLSHIAGSVQTLKSLSAVSLGVH